MRLTLARPSASYGLRIGRELGTSLSAGLGEGRVDDFCTIDGVPNENVTRVVMNREAVLREIASHAHARGVSARLFNVPEVPSGLSRRRPQRFES